MFTLFAAKEIFSDLNDKEIRFYDEKRAILTGEFVIEHIQFAGRGAIINIEVDDPVIQSKFPKTFSLLNIYVY